MFHDPTANQRERSSRWTRSVRKPTVLFVDDEPNILNGLKRFTRSKRAEWNLLFATGGEEALRAIQSAKVDMLVADMRMPGLDGADLMQRVSEVSSGTMRFILSGEADIHQTYRTVGRSHRYIAKPCDPQVIISTIEQLLLRRDLAGEDMMPEMGSVFDRLVVQRKTLGALSELLERNEPDTALVSKIVSQDSNLAARLLQIVNSGYFGRPTKTYNMGRAIDILGLDRIRDLLDQERLGQAVDTITYRPDQTSRYTPYELGKAAMEQVRGRNGNNEQQELAFSLGLFCFLGRKLASKSEVSPKDKYIAGNSVVFTAELLGFPRELIDGLSDLTGRRVELLSKEYSANSISDTVLTPMKIVA